MTMVMLGQKVTAHPIKYLEFRIQNVWKISLFPDAASTSSLLNIELDLAATVNSWILAEVCWVQFLNSCVNRFRVKLPHSAIRSTEHATFKVAYTHAYAKRWPHISAATFRGASWENRSSYHRRKWKKNYVNKMFGFAAAPTNQPGACDSVMAEWSYEFLR